MNFDSSEARNKTVFPISSSSPWYGSALYFIKISSTSVGILFSAAGVKINPGATPLQRILSLPYCVAIYRVKFATSALDAPLAERIVSTAYAAMEYELILVHQTDSN